MLCTFTVAAVGPGGAFSIDHIKNFLGTILSGSFGEGVYGVFYSTPSAACVKKPIVKWLISTYYCIKYMLNHTPLQSRVRDRGNLSLISP
jgi:hypothetical protein